MQQPIYAPNQKHLEHRAIKKHWDVEPPQYKIATYFNCLLTPTNHLFSNGRFIVTGIAKAYDNRQLHWVGQAYLYLKYRYWQKPIKHKGSYLYVEWSNNYYHWLCESLPRLLTLLDGNQEPLTLLLPQTYADTPFITDTLALANCKYEYINLEQSHWLERVHTIQTKPLWSIINPSAQRKVADLFLKGVSTKEAYQRVYLTRNNAKYRRVTNEQEIEDTLKAYRFDTIASETLSFSQQVALFSKTTFLVSLHGAGLTNLMFMPPNSKILEFRNKKMDSQPLCYFELANVFNIQWDYVFTESEVEETNFNDVKVDTEVLRMKLNEMLAS